MTEAPVPLAEQPTPEPIINQMKDCGDGRHVGWWEQTVALTAQHLLVEVKPTTVLISCCEGERAEKRINYICNREQAIEIVGAIAKALGIDLATLQQHERAMAALRKCRVAYETGDEDDCVVACIEAAKIVAALDDAASVAEGDAG